MLVVAASWLRAAARLLDELLRTLVRNAQHMPDTGGTFHCELVRRDGSAVLHISLDKGCPGMGAPGQMRDPTC